MLKTKVKASSVTNLTDARYFAAWEVEWLGFCLDPKSEDYVQPQVLKAMEAWVDGVQLVGEFDMQTADEIRTALELLPLDAIQVGPFTPVETLIELRPTVPVIKAIIPERSIPLNNLKVMLEEFLPHSAFLLLHFDRADISWQQLQKGEGIGSTALAQLCEDYPILLSINTQAEDLENLLETLKPVGLNVKGGAEEKVGYKSFDELDEIFEGLETFDE